MNLIKDNCAALFAPISSKPTAIAHLLEKLLTLNLELAEKEKQGQLILGP
jgi:hypothetical protein